MADENIISNAFSFDKTQTYNKVIFGKPDATKKETLIDMTHEGDTPESKTSATVDVIEASYILSSNVTLENPSSDDKNQAWGSDGKLKTGSCLYNADVSESTGECTLNSNRDAISGKTWKQGGPYVGNVDVHTGSMEDWRSKTGETETQLVVTPGDVGASTWTEGDEGYIIVNEEKGTHAAHTLPQGAYGFETESGSTATKIKFDVSNIIPYLCKTNFLFGIEGTYVNTMEEFNKDSYLDSVSWSVSDPSRYAGWASPLITKDTPINYQESSVSGSYEIYIGEYYTG